MIIFDSTSISFIKKSEQIVREILTSFGINVKRERFVIGNYHYPINIVVFEGKELAHFNAPYFQIALNRVLITSATDATVRDILKHELAHYLTYIFYGEVPHHGKEFHEICERFNISKETARATMNLKDTNESQEGNIKGQKVLEKVKKLLQLAQSSNTHEAELATQKANELLLRYNLEYLDSTEQEAIYVEKVLVQKRKDAKLAAIYDILKHFIVKPVLSYGKNQCALEVSGPKVNVELAQYVAHFLDQELDHLWLKAKKENGLEGVMAKNSFFIGVAKGFEIKMKEVKNQFSNDDKKSLIKIEKELTHNIEIIYGRLSQSQARNRIDEKAQNLGVDSGKKLTIRKGIETRKSNSFLSFIKP